MKFYTVPNTRIRDPGRTSQILFLRIKYVSVFWVKILKFFDTYPDPGSCHPRYGMGKSRIRDGSATLPSFRLFYSCGRKGCCAVLCPCNSLGC